MVLRYVSNHTVSTSLTYSAVLPLLISSEVSMSELLVIASRWPGGHCRTAWDECPLRIERDNLSAHVARR